MALADLMKKGPVAGDDDGGSPDYGANGAAAMKRFIEAVRSGDAMAAWDAFKTIHDIAHGDRGDSASDSPDGGLGSGSGHAVITISPKGKGY
jgi:hypothetical protein